MKTNKPVRFASQHLLRRHCAGSVMLVTMAITAILMLMVGTTLISTTNKYFTAYQWASWQEALQGAESGADIAMGELRKDVQSSTVGWVGWDVGKYKQVNGNKTTIKDTSTYIRVDSNGNYNKNGSSGGGGGTLIPFLIKDLATSGYDFVTYSTSLTSQADATKAHAGEGNTSLRITTTVDAPASLLDSSGRQWLRVRSSGSTDVAGPTRVSEEKLDNRLRKLSLFFDKVAGTAVAKPQATRTIELIAKPTSLFNSALMAMVQIKSDDNGIWTDSFNSEDKVNWPINKSTLEIDLTVSHDPTSPLGKNGDVGSNAFPIHHDHSENLDLKNFQVWGDVGNNYSLIKNLDAAYYASTPNVTNYGLNNSNYGTVNPTPNLIQTTTSAANGGDLSGGVSTNFYRDLPPVQDPNWTSGQITSNITVVNNKTADITPSTDPNNPTRMKVSAITLASGDKWQIKAPPKPSGWNATTNNKPAVGYVEIWVTGDIKLDDGGGVIIQSMVDAGSGLQTGYSQVKIYFDHNMKIGETKETKSNQGGFDVQSDDAKDLLIFGVTQPDAGKLPKDDYTDPLGNYSLYTPYKASGNIVFKETDFTGAVYAPDHNIEFDSNADGRGKRHKRKQNGNEFYGSFVGRTIHAHKIGNWHFDESLNDWGPISDWGFVSWFEDVDVDHR